MANATEYTCPCCGGSVKFDSKLQKMKCVYCESVFDVDTLEKFKEDLKADGTDDESWEQSGDRFTRQEADGIKIYHCNYCGGDIMADVTTSASTCPYCDNPVIMQGNISGEWRPEKIIPFKLDKTAAVEQFKKHLLKKHFLPKPFRDINHFEEIKGVYVPFWLFDSHIDATIRFRATKIRRWSRGDYDYTETSYYSVTRGGSMEFEKIAIDGSQQMADDLMESIEPFDYRDAVPFSTGYLAGYVADKYDVDENISVVRANNRILHSVDSAFKSTVKGYATCSKVDGNIDYHNAKAVYALYPVWILTTKYQEKNYMFAMNGQTGKFVGDLPLDKKIFTKWMIFGTTGLTLLGTAVSMLINYLTY